VKTLAYRWNDYKQLPVLTAAWITFFVQGGEAMKTSKRSRWFILIPVMAVVLTMFMTHIDSAWAIIDGAHAFNIYLRLETEIMQKTPAGQYYESLFWKHNDEIMQIMNANPEHDNDLFNTMLFFAPALEALENGDGDQAYITTEHVNRLKTEMDWFAAMGSSGLREDIQREEQRLPLDTFVGMSMNEAWDFINSIWSPDSAVEKNLVPDSDGKWAYYIHDGVYFEYPSQYTVQVAESEKEYVYFIPTTDMPEAWHPFVMKIKVWEVPSTANTDVHTWYSQSNILWEAPVQNTDFQGFEFIKAESFQRNVDPSSMDMHTFLYNPQNRLAIEIWVLAFEPPSQGAATEYRQLVDQRYGYFQHMVDNLRIQKP